MAKITIPEKPVYEEIGQNIGKVYIDGCYPGFGTTLGNSLRRVLLSSLEGAAAVSVKIKGASHEFSSIPGIYEDLIQIILNMKKVRFRMHNDEPVRLTLKEKGVKKITAAQIQCPADVEVVNQDAPIAEITDKKAELDMEIEVRRGLGYVPVEQQERDLKEIGLIAMDAIYTPVRRVNYQVENTRVGKRTDFDKISIEIETDGTISPFEAYEKAVEIIIEQFSAIKKQEAEAEAERANIVEGEVEMEIEEKKTPQVSEVEVSDPLQVTINKLSFSTRTVNVLEKKNIATIADIVKYSEEEIMEFEGMGEKGIKEIKKAVGNFGLTLR